MKIFVQALLLMLVTFGAAHAEVTATLDRNPVTQGETVTLTIRVVDEKGEPDLGVLSADFRVLGQNTSSQVQYSKGSVSKWKDLNVQLLPKCSG
ncbi:MAG: BatD family protein, partial [Gammaproteobacteria bacterium]|nr:BatD family protein [Gammaproteobacteria bacterium]